MPKPPRKSNGKVLPFPNNLYARWRLESGAVPLLREDGDSPPECLLQAIWQHQRLKRDQLLTLDGRVVRVLHPGFINRQGGPDFRGAVLQIGNSPPRSGDVEVDLHPGGWRAHGHDRNPAFEQVILHVIWDGAQSAHGAPPALVVGDKLDAPVGELSFWLDSEAAPVFPEQLRGRCVAGWHRLSSVQQAELLRNAAQIRFQAKAARFQARAREAGWEQALWEGIFRALGYRHNTWPMQCLAERRTHWLAPDLDPSALQARLLGISSLLPFELTRAQTTADGYLRRVWDQWWREREEFQDYILPRSLWRFHGQRPANHPQRRLALAAHWLAEDALVSRIERWCATDLPDQQLAGSLLECLQIGRDEFWSWHWTIRSARLDKAQPLLGRARVTDLAANAILPWLWVRAVEGKNTPLQRVIEHRFHAWRPAEDNLTLRSARQRLLGGAPRTALRTMAEQQGLMQIVRDFCEHSNALCDSCAFPELLARVAR